MQKHSRADDSYTNDKNDIRNTIAAYYLQKA